MVQSEIREPFPIFKVAHRYLLFDIHTISYIRCEHNICGVLVGNIPQAAQQTVFSGIPLELMPEEARLLVQQGHAFIIDDVLAHDRYLADLDPRTKHNYTVSLKREGLDAAEALQLQALEKKKAHFNKAGFSANSLSAEAVGRMQVTPTTSYPPLKALDVKTIEEPPIVPQSYPVFAHLHDKGYFMGPGLRFGCQYVAYPSDPLRYHSHFLVTGHEWDEEIDLLDIVGGGRLGTGVKKGYMIGGATPDDQSDDLKHVRTFSFEWAAM